LSVEQLEARILMNAADEQFVLRLYDDLLERQADPSGLQSWSGMLDQGASRMQVAEGFLGSAEHESQLIGNMYESLLKRAPEPLGLSSWLQFLQTGGRTDQVEALILGSPEYYSAAGASANAFLVSLYHDVLGRSIDPSGLATFTNALQSGVTRTQVASAIVDSPEARGNLISWFYIRFLDRDADSTGLQDFLNAMGQGARPEDVEAAILGSSEYFNDFVATPAPPVTDRSALAVPGTAGQTVTATFTASGVSTAYANEFGIFPVDDAAGRIGTIEPGDPGYEAAALTEPGARVVLAQPPTQGETATVNLPGGTLLGLYLVPNGTTAEAKANNPNDQLGQLPFVYFSFASANPDRFEHIHSAGNQFAFEDMFGGGDRDFNDLVVTVDFSQPTPLQTDHNPPVVTLTSPSNGLVTRQNPTVSGHAVDDQSGVASVEAEVDGGAPFPISFDSTGNFSFTTSLPVDGSADGSHTVDVRATDKAGNVSSFVSTAFTLDTVPPTVSITSPTTALNTSTNVTITGRATDIGSRVAQVEEQIDGGAFTPVTFDASGNFSFTTNLPLDGSADGQHTVDVQATDKAGNLSAPASYSFVLDTSTTRSGTTLVEGASLVTPFQKTFTVPSQPSELQFTYNLSFDNSAQFINDAFEASLTDANGNSLVLPITSSQDAFLNISQEQAPLISPNIQLNNGTVDVDLSHITPGTQATLTIRLVNTDSDTGTTVHFSDPQIVAATMNTPAAVTPAPAPPAGSANIDFSGLTDVTTSMTAVYGETSLNQQSKVLLVGLAVKNTGTFPVDAPLVAVISGLSDPSIRVRNRDGVTPGGLPYFDLSGFIGGDTLAPGQSSTGRTLAFYDPNGIQFTYELQILGQLNRPPTITSQPNTEAIPGLPYVYQATAKDPDNDRLTFSLLVAPAGMTVDPNSGKITWNPQSSDLGNEAVLLQVDDGRGGTTQQPYTVSTIAAPPDRPPLFTSTPIVQANVDTAYTYQATATDPDQNPLTFSVTGPTGLSVDASSGLVSWTPTAAQLGIASVTLTVADGHGGTAVQTYSIDVLSAPNNDPPLIVSNPVTVYTIPPAGNPSAGSTNPNGIQLTLANGQTSNQTVSLSGLGGGALTLNSTVSGNIGTPGQQDNYTFTLTTNALLYFDALTNASGLQWSLQGPAGTAVSNRSFVNLDADTFTGGGPVMALPAGPYTLAISGSGATTSPYAFRLSNLAMASPITVGSTVNDTLNPALSTNLYQFTANAGDQDTFTGQVPANGLHVIWRLIDPYGNVLFDTGIGNVSPVTLTATGTYYLLFQGPITGTGTQPYSFSVQFLGNTPPNNSGTPLTLGSTVNGTLTTAGQQNAYAFSLAANAQLYFDALTNGDNLQWSLRGPPGTVVSNRFFTESDGQGIASGNPVLSLPAGTYVLTVISGLATDAYSFRLLNLATATALTPGSPVQDTLNPANSTNAYQFNAATGQSFYFAGFAGDTTSTWWRLIDPFGNVLFSTYLKNDGGRLNLTATGTYTLLVEGYIAATGSTGYSFSVDPITDPTQPLTLGSLVNANLTTPGEKDRYTFSLAAHALLYFDSLTNSANIQWSLTGPAGTTVNNAAFSSSDGEAGLSPLILPAGAYTLTVSGIGPTTGGYAFRLSDLSTAAPLTPGTAVSATLNPADSTDAYAFNVTAGETFYFGHLTSSAAGWRLLDPFGNVVFKTFLFGNDPGRLTLTATGRYTVLVEGDINDTGTDSYSFNVFPVVDTVQPLGLGNLLTGNLADPGELDHYTFSLSSGALLYFDALPNNSNLQWSLSGPVAAVTDRSFLYSDSGNIPNPVLSLPAGAYTLTVSGIGQTSGPYSFRLSNLAAAPALTPGTPLSDTLNPADSTNFYQFNANAGDQFDYVHQAGSGAPDAVVRLIGPYGNVLLRTFLSANAGPVTVAATGIYYLLVEGSIADTGSGTYTINLPFLGNVPPNPTGTLLTLGTTVTGTLATAGQSDQYVFTLANTTLAYFDAQTDNSNLQWSLNGPPGTVVSNLSFTSSDGRNAPTNPVRVLPAGTYTLTVSAAGQNTGSYAFRLSDLSTAVPLTLGTAVNDTLNPANSTNFYQFAGSAGQTLYFADVSSGSIQAGWRLVDPYGNVVFDSSLDTDAGRVNLLATGTYTLLVEGNISETGTVNYSFNVFPVMDTSQPLTVGESTSGSLAAPSERDNYTFTLAAASRLYFDSLTNNANIQWSLVGPGGTAVNDRLFTQSDAAVFGAGSGPADPVLELPAGAYTLTVTGVGDATGSYAFRLLDLAAAASVTINTPVMGALSPGNSTNLYQFNAQAGQTFYFASNDLPFTLTGGAYQWRLLDPYDNVLFKTILGSDAGLVTLPASGTYTLLIEGAITNTANNGYNFTVEQPGVEVVASQAGVPFTDLTGVVANLTQPTFQVQLQGNGQAQVYDLLFEAPATGNQLGSIPVSIDAQYLYQVRAVDADGDTLTYQLTQAPAGMQIDPTSGLITWVPTAAQVGQDAVTVQVNDGRGGIDTQSFSVTVLNTAPGGISGTVYNDQNGSGSRTSGGNPVPPGGPFQPIGTPFPEIGSDSEPAIFITIGPGGAISTMQTGQGPYDGSDDTYLAIINESNSGVAVESLGMSGNDNIFGFDADGISTFVTKSSSNNSIGANLTGYEGPGTYFSDYNALGSGLPLNAGKVNFDDGQGNGLQPGQETYFSLEGVPTVITADIVAQVAPVTIEPALPGFTVYLDLNHDGKLDPGDPSTVSDALGHYSFSNLAPGTYTVALLNQPGYQVTQPTTGTYTAVVQSGQVTANLDFGDHQISTNPRPPAITSTAPTTASTDETYQYDVTVSNPDGVALQFDLPVKPAGMAIDPQSGVIAWNPAAAQVGSQDVIVRLTDSRGEVVLQHFVINVTLEAPPVITSTPPTPAVTGLLYHYQVVAQDASNNPLTYTLLQGPAGMAIDSGTGLLTWVGAPLGAGLPSSFQVSLQVSDGLGGQDTQTYTLFVVTSSANIAPVITSSPPTSVGLGHVYLYNVVATDPNGLPLTYTLTTAPAGMTIDSNGMIRWTPTEDEFGANAVTLRVDNGQVAGVAQQSFTVQVVAEPNNLPPQITSHPPLAATLGTQYVYNLTGTDPDNTLLIWSLDTAPEGMTIDPMQGFVRWTPTVEELGSQNVTVRLTNGEGLDVTQSFVITVRALDVPPLITSTPPTQATIGLPYAYPIQTTDAEGISLTFSLTSGPLGMTIDSVTGQVQWLPLQNEIGPQNVAIEVDDGQGGQATQTWTIVTSAQPPEQPPTITSTPGFAATVQQPYTYQVTATNPENVTLQYSLPSAPAGMTIDPASGLIQWTPTTGQLGLTAVLVAVADGLGGTATQTYALTVQPPDQPPTITSTPITSATAGAPYEYDVAASDPDGDPLTYSLTTAPSGMTIDTLGRITWSPGTGNIGPNNIHVVVSGRGGLADQTYTLTVVADTVPPQVSLTLSANQADQGTPVTAIVTATDNVGIASMSLTLNGNPVVLDSMGQATLPDNAVGSFTLVATASDAAGNVGTDSQTLTVINPQVTNAPVVALTTPADNDMVTAPTQVIGTVQDPNLVSYTLSVAPIGSDSFTTISTGTSQVTNGVLGTLDPTMLQDDSYDLRLIATNTGGLSSEADVTVNVSDNLKLGNFRLSFTDLTIPVSGIPITVTRTYDSLNANESEDFGYGWQLEYRDVDLQTSVASTGMKADGFFNPFQENTHVYVTLPGGERQGFTFQPTLAPGLDGSFLGIFQPTFVPDPGVTSALTVANAALTADSDGTFHDFTTGDPYNPGDPLFGGSYVLTTNAGDAYTIDAFTGQLTSVSDANGNTLTFSDAGITSSTGVGITFQRDPQGRITAIIDPMGNRIQYQYDANGDLVAVTDRTGNTTQFVYLTSPAHYLNQVIDPLGRTGVRTNYDAQGRLIQETGVAGNPIQLSYDPSHSIETVTDQNGNTTTDEYDSRGNLVTQVDALGAVTRRTFDADNNMLTETDALGRTTTYTYDDLGDKLTETDALGNTTIYTYQDFTFGTSLLFVTSGGAQAPFTRLKTSTDPLGNTTTFSYDFFGNLVARTDPLGNTTTASNNGAGEPTAITDPLGNVTQINYDADGNRTELVDPDGHVTNFTTDADGNPLSQTQANGGGWSLTYNANGQPTSVGLIGSTQTVQYNGLNQITQVTDATGQTAALSYDALGQVTQVTLPDGTVAETNTYDAVGNLLTVTDSLGNVTRYAYDADNRLIQTTYPDGSTEERTYDLAGELVKMTDALGNNTRYVYDAAGRQIQTIDALGGVTSSQYDADGQMVATTDPLGRTTRFQYDAAGRKVATIAPDGSTTRSVYDADGRLAQTVDAAGNVTTYGYDPSGNLISVTDPLGNVTRYQYDDNNERVAMTDAKGNITRYSYDTQGHLVQTIQPDGETDSSTYNSAGKLASTTNGDGQTIHYGYDNRGRQTSLTLPGGSQETYTYTSDGLISSVTDASGTTRYDYDPLTRLLVRITEPDGRYIRYAYDADSNRTLMATSMGAGQPEDITQYAYDALGRLVQVTDSQGGVTTYTYDADGDLITSTLPNGITETDTYDTLNRLIGIVDQNTNGAIISSFTYTLDANGDRTKEVDADGSSIIYAYDALNRVTSEDHFDSSGVSTGAEVYTYDAVGNVTARSGTLLGNATFSYNGDNQLVSGAGSTYTYDAAGNQVSVTDSSGNVTRYSYDALGRLVGEQDPDGATTTYTYDYQGVRQSQQGPDGLIKFLVDEANGPSSAQVVRESDSTGTTLRTYVIGLGLISFTEGGAVRYYLTDALGSTRALSDQTGAVTDTYLYSAYGVLLVHTGSSDNSFLFAGQQQDGSSGLVYLRARYYDPATARFLSRDSFAGSDQLPLSLNKYLYASANPVNLTDPSGNDDLAEEGIGLAGQANEEAAENTISIREYTDIYFRIAQTIGGVMTVLTVVEALFEPEQIGSFFGGFLAPPPIKKLIGLTSEITLSQLAYKLLSPSTIYYIPDPAILPPFYAQVFPTIATDIVYLGELFATFPLLPQPGTSRNNVSQVGGIVHEFAHLIYTKIGDVTYGIPSLVLSPIQALYNADNYRIAVEAVFLGLSAEQVFSGE